MIAGCLACGSQGTTIIETFSTTDFLRRFISEVHGELRHDALEVSSVVAGELPSRYDMVRCGACGLEAASPMCAGSSRFYEVVYRYMSARRAAWEFGQFERDLSAPQRVLDVGCGDGSFVAYARGRGYDVEGLDFNPSLVEGARDADLPVHLVDACGLPKWLQGHDYPVFTMWQVLEHLSDPIQTLSELRQGSAAGTRLVVAVPSDRFYLTAKSRRLVLDYPPRHLTRWTPRALRAAGARAGWRLDLHRYEDADGALREYGPRLIKSLLLNRNLLNELRSFMTQRRFSPHAFLAEYDHRLNSLVVRVLGRGLYYLMRMERHGCTGMTQYAIFTAH